MKTSQKQPPDPRKTVLIVDDHAMMRYGLTRLIQQQPDLRVYGEVENAERALAGLKTPPPDLVLTDLTMPGKSGLELIKHLHINSPSIPVLVLSMHDENIFAERALRAGARGYIMKNEGSDRLLEAIRRVLRGEFYVSDHVSGNIMSSFTKARSDTRRTHLTVLTDREFEVFVLLSQAMHTEEISQRLCISGKTVETHRMHIKEKLKLKSGAEVRKYAIRWGASQGMI